MTTLQNSAELTATLSSSQAAEPKQSSLQAHTALPADKTIPFKKKGGKANTKTGKTRAGVPNYNTAEIDVLLDIVEELLPLGSQDWVRVAERFAVWATENISTPRDMDSLKSKFDKMNNTRKSTGDPAIPPSIRRAKIIGRELLNKCCAGVLGGEDCDTFVESADEADETVNKKVEMIGERKGKRLMGAAGLPSGKQYDTAMLEIAGSFKDSLENMATAATQASISKEEVIQIVREESVSKEEVTNVVRGEVNNVRKEISETIASHSQNVINQMKDFIQTAISSRQTS